MKQLNLQPTTDGGSLLSRLLTHMEAVVLLRVGLVVLLCSFIYSTSSTSSISRTISLTLLMFNYNVYLAFFFACVSPFGAYNMNFEL